MVTLGSGSGSGLGGGAATATSQQYVAAFGSGLGSGHARGINITQPVLTAWWYPLGYPLDRGSAYAQIEISENSAKWEEQLSEAGAGEYLTQNVEPDGTPITRPSVGDVIAFDIGSSRAWSMLVEGYDRHRIRSGGVGKQQTTIRGRGHLAVMEQTLIYPTLGYSSFPQQVDMYYDYRHVFFDSSTWAYANHICVMSQAVVPGFWTGIPFISWSDGWDLSIEDTHIIWGNGGTRLVAPAGKCYFRQLVSLPVDGVYWFYFGADDTATAFLDGVPIATATPFNGSPQRQEFQATAGLHILSIEATNANNGFVKNNPGGIAYLCLLPSLFPSSSNVMFSSTTGNIVTKEYPPEPPGMTPGEAIIRAIDLAQSRGDIPQVLYNFDFERDSAGNSWAVTPTISTKILTDLMTFLREVSASYADIRMDPSSWTLQAFNKSTMNASLSGVSFLPSVNVEGLEQRGDLNVVNVAVGVTKFGYLEVEDSASVATYGRRPALIEIGAVDSPYEAIRVLTKALEQFARVREEITAQTDGTLGYVHYPLGKTITTVDSDDNAVQERVVAIGVRQHPKTGRVLTTPTLKDLYLA